MRFILALTALFGLLTSCAQDREPFYGAHQSGIGTAAQKHAFVAAFDLTTTDVSEVRRLFQDWTKAADSLTQGKPVAGVDATSVPPSDTGEALGLSPERLTLTFGVGPSFFDDRFGLKDRRPAALAPLPAFPGDQLRSQWSDGDLVIQAAADDVATAYHAIHTLARMAKGRAEVRWSQQGFQSGRNLQGFLDGTVNPDTTKPEVMDKVVWADASSDWMAGGSYLVVRKIRMFVEVWDRSSLGDQEATVGRERAKGAELPQMDPSSHVLQARGGGVEKILRRPFHYTSGLDERTGQWDSGLLFLAWMKDPRAQFVPMQTRLSSFDRLNEYIQVQGSAVFAAFPGVAPGSYLGAALLPEPSLTSTAEALIAAVGSTYPSLAREDWAAVGAGASTWWVLWDQSRGRAADRAPAIDALASQWRDSLAAEPPRAADVRAAQSALIQALDDWRKANQPRVRASALDLQPLVNDLKAVNQALDIGSTPQARDALAQFQKDWVARESLVRSLNTSVYAEVELGIAKTRAALSQEAGPDAKASVVHLVGQLESVRPPQAFGAWDAGFLLFREGLEALLVLAALLTFLARTGQQKRTPWVWAGAGAGLVASVGAAVGLSVLLTGWMAATAPVLIEGVAGLTAVALMLTVGLWLHGKATVKNWNVWMKERMGKVGTSGWALAALALVAVLREGAETVVFFWGLAGSISGPDLLLGMGGALAVLVVLGVAMIGFSKRLPLQWFFPIATGLIYLLAVKILGQSLVSLQAAGVLSSTIVPGLPTVDLLGLAPTWESALPQLVLTLVLATLVIRPLIKKPNPAT